MKKHIFWIAIIAFFGLFMSYDASAQGRGYGHRKHHYKEQKRINKAYRHGYYQGIRHANRYDRRHHGYYAHHRPYGYYHRPYRHRRHHAYYAPAPRPHVRGNISINIPLPPHP